MLFSNMYNLNGFGGMGNMFSQGLGMFGNFGCGSLGMGGSIFTNCYGEPNFDKMAGLGIANAVLGVGVTAAQSLIQSKEPKVDNSEQLKNITNQLNTKNAELKALNTEKTTLTSKKQTATAEKTKLQDKLNGLNLSSLEIDLENARNAYKNASEENKATLKTELNNAEKAYKTAKAKEAELNEQIAEQKEIIQDAENRLPDIEQKISALNIEIKKLEAQKTQLETNEENKKADKTLNKADGTWIQRKLGGDNKKMYTNLHKFRKLKEEYDKNHASEIPEELSKISDELNGIYNGMSTKDKETFAEAMKIVNEFNKPQPS